MGWPHQLPPMPPAVHYIARSPVRAFRADAAHKFAALCGCRDRYSAGAATVAALLRHGAAAGHPSPTPLRYSVQSTVLRDSNNTALCLSLKTAAGDGQLLQLLPRAAQVQEGGGSSSAWVSVADSRGESALGLSVRFRRSFPVLKALLQAGADPSYVSPAPPRPSDPTDEGDGRQRAQRGETCLSLLLALAVHGSSLSAGATVSAWLAGPNRRFSGEVVAVHTRGSDISFDVKLRGNGLKHTSFAGPDGVSRTVQVDGHVVRNAPLELLREPGSEQPPLDLLALLLLQVACGCGAVSVSVSV